MPSNRSNSQSMGGKIVYYAYIGEQNNSLGRNVQDQLATLIYTTKIQR